MTATASLLFAVINPNAIYWAFGFPAAVVSVVGADFVFAAGTIYVAKVSLPHQQSLAGALFQTMTQVIAMPLPDRFQVIAYNCLPLAWNFLWNHYFNGSV